MNKIIEFFKNIKENFTLKTLEKLALSGGATLFALFGLIWNLNADIKHNSTSSLLFIGLLTAVVGGVLIFVGSTFNTFDVKTKGLVLISVGIVLGIGNIIYLLVGPVSLTGLSIVVLVFMILGTILSITGLVLQVYRRIVKYDE